MATSRPMLDDSGNLTEGLFTSLHKCLQQSLREFQKYVPAPIYDEEKHKSRRLKRLSVRNSPSNSKRESPSGTRRDSWGSRSPEGGRRNSDAEPLLISALPEHWVDNRFVSPLPVFGLPDEASQRRRSLQIEPLHLSEGVATQPPPIWESVSRAFNEKPSEGVELARRFALLQNTEASGVAQFLHEAPGLRLDQIGEYLAKNPAVLEEFVSGLDFTGLDLCSALRIFFSKFRLPGEAQVVDRMVEAFASVFVKCNPESAFSSDDTVYVLSFSIVMLNTDRHNPAIKPEKKMTFEEFTKNNRGIDDGKDVPFTVLREIFDDVSEQEMKMAQDAVSEGSQSAWSRKKVDSPSVS
jgi:Sec7 domain